MLPRYVATHARGHAALAPVPHPDPSLATSLITTPATDHARSHCSVEVEPNSCRYLSAFPAAAAAKVPAADAITVTQVYGRERKSDKL
jgi:hypothetical protein